MKIAKALFLLFLLIFIPFSAQAKIIYVPDDSSTIQGGINGALDGDTVVVARGHYYERINFLGKGILVASNFIFDNDTTTIDSTVIDGDTLVLGVADTGSVVCFVSGEDSASVIQGFTIQYGIGISEDPVPISSGGGIFCDSASPVIRNNIITQNIAHYGAGIRCFSSSPIIEHNRIIKNLGLSGAGIHCRRSSPIISHNTIAENLATNGGAVSCYDMSSPTISRNIITRNFGYTGGGIYCSWSSPTINCNIVTGNSAQDEGGGIFCYWESPAVIINNIIANDSALHGGGIACYESWPSIKNNTIAGNYSFLVGAIYCKNSNRDESFPIIINNIISNTLRGGGIYCEDATYVTISHNDFWNNRGEFYNCPGGIGDTTWGSNINGIPCDSLYNIVRNPLFVDTLNDFHLRKNSPCIDAGDNTFAPVSDLDGNPRIVDGNEDDSATVDMGAFEF